MEENLSILVAVAEELSYKPDHIIVVRQNDDDTATISLRCKSLSDASLNDSQVGDNVGLTINNTIELASIVSPLDAMHAFAQLIADFELHESAEFFKYKGRRVFLPHGWDNKSNESGKFGWSDFVDLNGQFLRALKQFMGNI